MYGVSPQPEHAPEYSNSGWKNCEPLTSTTRRRVRSTSGSSSKNSKLLRSASSRGGGAAMRRDFRLVSFLSWAGQMTTHREQPVQSSGATWIVYFQSLKSIPRNVSARKPAGAPSRKAGSYTLARIAAWGQTRTHLLHWMQSDGSHTGISSAMFRFSYLLVPDGHVPSGGKAETGRASPCPAMMVAVTRRTKSGASSGTGKGITFADVTESGTSTRARFSSARSTAARF